MPRPSIILTLGASLAILLAACSSDDGVDDGDPVAARRLTVDLQDGFDGVTVVVIVNGRTVAELESVTTDEMLGLAESVEVEIPEGSTELTVRVGDELEGDVAFDADGERFVGVSLTGGRLVTNVSEEPFGYG